LPTQSRPSYRGTSARIPQWRASASESPICS
jgi:hypothetical protein